MKKEGLNPGCVRCSSDGRVGKYCACQTRCTAYNCAGIDNPSPEEVKVNSTFTRAYITKTIEVDPAQLQPGDVIVAVTEHDDPAGYRDIRVTVERKTA